MSDWYISTPDIHRPAYPWAELWYMAQRTSTLRRIVVQRAPWRTSAPIASRALGASAAFKGGLVALAPSAL